jgi:hypothetical protein
VSYKDGWYQATNYLRNAEFACFMTNVFNADNAFYAKPPSYWKKHWAKLKTKHL